MPVPYTLITQKAPEKSGRNDTITYARTVSRGIITQDDLAEKLVEISTLSRADIAGVLAGMADLLPDLLKDGYRIKLSGIGTLQLNASTGAVEKPERVRQNDFKKPRISFNPDKRLKQSCKTCRYIRSKKLIK